MTVKILTLFPKMFDALNESITGRAVKAGIVNIEVIDIRDFSKDKHKKCDDIPFGGGAGMIMTPVPIYDAVEFADKDHKCNRIYMSPKGKSLSTALAKEICAENKDLLILCGRYEGVDQRVLDMCFDTEISIGDYILTGGELAAMVLTDVCARFIPGVLGSPDSAEIESFSDGLLEYPQYTRPYDFMGEKVPDVLLSGHHGNIDAWRRDRATEITRKLRPDLLKNKDK